MFSGGDFHEVARWLQNFLASHAKRESARIEAVVDADDDRPTVYGVRLRLGERSSPRVELDFKTVADNRGSLTWCNDMASQVRRWARELLTTPPPGNQDPR